MTSISRSNFLTRFKDGINLNAPDVAQKVDASTLQKLKALDTNGDGLIQGSSSLGKAWRIVDNFDTNGNANSIAGAGKAADLMNALSPANATVRPAAGPVTTGGSVAAKALFFSPGVPADFSVAGSGEAAQRREPPPSQVRDPRELVA